MSMFQHSIPIAQFVVKNWAPARVALVLRAQTASRHWFQKAAQNGRGRSIIGAHLGLSGSRFLAPTGLVLVIVTAGLG